MKEPPKTIFIRVLRITAVLAVCSAFVVVPLIFLTTEYEYNPLVYDVPKECAWAVFLTSFVFLSFVAGRRAWDARSLLLSMILLGIWVSCFRAVNLGVALADAFLASLLVAMPILASRTFRSGRLVRWAAVCLAAGAALAAFYALAQRMGWDPMLSHLVGLAKEYRLGGSLGGPEETALYLAAVFPLVTALFLSNPWGARRGFAGLVGVAMATAVFLGGHRLAFLVALAGTVVLGVCILVPRRRVGSDVAGGSRRTAGLVVAVVAAVFAVGLAVSPPGGTAAQNVRRGSLRLATQNAFLGAGPANWGIVFPLYLPREYGAEITRQSGPTAPDILRVWGEWGALGLAGLVVLVLMLLTGAVRKSGRDADGSGWVTTGAAAAVVALFTCGFAGGPLERPAMRFLFWSLAAVALAGVQLNCAATKGHGARSNWQLAFRVAGGALLAVVGFVMLGRVSMPHFMASRLHLNALWWRGTSKSIPVFERATDLVPHQPAIWADVAENYVRLADSEDRQSLAFKDYAVKAQNAGKQALQLLPNEAALLFRYGTALDLQPGTRPWEKLVVYQRATGLSPATAAFHLALGRAYMILSSRPQVSAPSRMLAESRAVKEWKKALELDPENTAAAYNLALDARNRQRPEEAFDYIRLILRVTPHHREAIELLAQLGYRLEDLKATRNLQQIAAYWQSQIEKNPRDPGNYYRAGEAYEELGNEELALLMYRKAFLRDPEYLPAVRKLKARGISLDQLLREGESSAATSGVPVGG